MIALYVCSCIKKKEVIWKKKKLYNDKGLIQKKRERFQWSHIKNCGTVGVGKQGLMKGGERKKSHENKKSHTTGKSRHLLTYHTYVDLLLTPSSHL